MKSSNGLFFYSDNNIGNSSYFLSKIKVLYNFDKAKSIRKKDLRENSNNTQIFFLFGLTLLPLPCYNNCGSIKINIQIRKRG